MYYDPKDIRALTKRHEEVIKYHIKCVEASKVSIKYYQENCLHENIIDPYDSGGIGHSYCKDCKEKNP